MCFLRALHLVLVLLCLFQTIKSEKNICASEYSVINIDGKIHKFVWKSESSYSYYSVAVSNPPCLNSNKNLIAKICSNNSWIPSKDDCHYAEENTKCPPDCLQQDDLCVYITEPQSSQRDCPFSGSSINIIAGYDTLVWAPITRNALYGIFEYNLPGEHYGEQIFSEHVETFQSTLDEDKGCVVATKEGSMLSPCDSLHPHICSYKYNKFLHRCPKNCLPGGLGSDVCFCKIQKSNAKRNEFCETLAVPRYSYERHILQKLVHDDTCWVGNIQENSDIGVDFFKSDLYLTIDKHKWGLYRNGEITCALCRVNAISYDKADLVLKFSSKSHKLYLEIYSPESLFREDDDDLVYCFTDATEKLKKRVETEKKWESDSGRSLKVLRVSVSEDGPGNYWCEAFQLPEVDLIRSNIVVAYKEFKGHEYSLRLVIYNICRFSVTHCKNPSVSFIIRVSRNLFLNRLFAKFVKKVRLFQIYNIDRKTGRLDVLLHLTTQSKLPLIAEYFLLNRNMQWLRFQQTSIRYFRSSEACLPQNTLSGNSVLHWKLSAIGVIRTPDEICVTENGTPVRRQCQGDFLHGSEWGYVEGDCSQNISLSSKTKLLHSLVSSDDLSVDLTKNISAVTVNSNELTALDLHYLAEALSKVSFSNSNNSEEFIDELSQIIDNLMNTNTTTMQLSQAFLNATDEILDIFENTLVSVNASRDLFLLKKSNLIIQITKPFISNVSGLVIYGKDDLSSFLDCKVNTLYSNSSLDVLINDDQLELAVFVPEKLLELLSQNLSLEFRENIIIVTTIYYSDKFFNDANITDIVASRVVGVSIPGYDDYIQSAVPIIFKSLSKHNKEECAFWNYGISSETHIGYWSTLGGNYMGRSNNTALEICSFTHLTNFALLVRSSDFSVADSMNISFNNVIIPDKGHNEALTLISNIGSLLSMFGIFGIFSTSLIFQSWREKVGTKILIQLCFTIFLQIIFLNLADVGSSKNNLENYCTIVGVILHYVIISEFCWMLVAAILQFFRFVKVIGPMPNRIILKAGLIGWGLPLIPVLIVCAVDYQSYSSGIQGLCYPKGAGMYYGVLFPVALIIIANLAVFVAVVRNVFVLKVEPHNNSHSLLKRQICLAVLLFFLLGLPWIFGLLGEIINHDSVLSYILIYLFCITISLQGFVLFIFYVVLDKSTRTMWSKLLKKMLNRKLC